MDPVNKLIFLRRALQVFMRKRIPVAEGFMLVTILDRGPLKLEAIMELAVVGKHTVKQSEWLRSKLAQDGTAAHVYFLSPAAEQLFGELLAGRVEQGFPADSGRTADL